ncbi:MAG: PTS sugar transporter subunit IIA [Candidatus Njordarchaeia archaeon]
MKKEAIKTNVEAKDWREAVRKIGEILVKIGAAEPQYVDAMIKTVLEMGPYIVMAKGIALPHARPEEGAKKPALAIVKLKTPVEFGNPDNDPVGILIAFSTPDSKAHVKALSQLAKILMKQENIEKLRKANAPSKIYEIFKEAIETSES